MPKDNKNNKTYSEEQKKQCCLNYCLQTTCQFQSFQPKLEYHKPPIWLENKGFEKINNTNSRKANKRL